MCKRAVLALAAVALLSPIAQADDTKTIDPAKGEKAVKTRLEESRAGFGQVTLVKDANLAKVFPRHLFFTAHFRQYPIARELPEPLQFANVFAYSADEKLTLINKPQQMEKFFKENVREVKIADDGKVAVQAWLKLSPELQQDGFYKFVLMGDSTKAELSKQEGAVTASGKVIVMQGGNGEINAQLVFNTGDGKLMKVKEESKIRPGPRPICQATKLLDADPLVRKMAEQDLLIMGRPAKGYLDEQRGRASPDLRKAIDRMWQRIVEQ